jgi:hypothetical protein
LRPFLVQGWALLSLPQWLLIVLLSVCRAQSVASTQPQHGGRLGAKFQDDSDLCWGQTFDVDVPEHCLPSFGHLPKSLDDDFGLKALNHWIRDWVLNVESGEGRGFENLEVFDSKAVGRFGLLGHYQIAHHGEQISAEESIGAFAALEHLEHKLKRIGYTIIRVHAGAGCQSRGMIESRFVMAFIQNRENSEVP